MWRSIAEARAVAGRRGCRVAGEVGGAEGTYPGGGEAAAPHLLGPSTPYTELCVSRLMCILNLIISVKGAAPPSRTRCKLQVPQNLNPPLGDGGWVERGGSGGNKQGSGAPASEIQASEALPLTRRRPWASHRTSACFLFCKTKITNVLIPLGGLQGLIR